MTPLREEAEYWRIVLAMGLVDPEVVVAWADRIITDLDKPPVELMDVSMARRVSRAAFLDLLSAIPGEGDAVAAAHRALGLFHLRFQAGDMSLEHAAEALHAYSNWASVPDHERYCAANFDEVVYCLRMGYAGTPESVADDITNFLESHASKPPAAQ